MTIFANILEGIIWREAACGWKRQASKRYAAIDTLEYRARVSVDMMDVIAAADQAALGTHNYARTGRGRSPSALSSQAMKRTERAGTVPVRDTDGGRWLDLAYELVDWSDESDVRSRCASPIEILFLIRLRESVTKNIIRRGLRDH